MPEPNQSRELKPSAASVAANLPALDVIRSETVLSRFPVHNLSKKGNVDIHIVRKNPRGEVEIRWEVSFNEKYGQARQLAYKLDTLVVNRRLEEEGRPLPKLIRLGSLREIADRLDLGSNTNIVKRALRQNASAFISIRAGYTNLQGVQKTIEADFTRYSVIFTGEKLPDKSRADAVYLNLHDVYWTILNEAPWRPLDFDYLKALNPAAQRFYEIISYRFYNALRFRNLNASRISYSEYCLYSAQQRYYDYEHFKKQMYKIHQPHRQSGYISEVRYEPASDAEGRPDWIMWYIPGAKAQREFEAFTGLACPSELRLDNDGPPSLEPAAAGSDSAPDLTANIESDLLVEELVKRGIMPKQAAALVDALQPGQLIFDQLEYADYRIASEHADAFRNPPGFYVSVIRDNVPVPEHFETTRKRKEREPSAQAQLPLLDAVDYEQMWLDYKRQTIESHIGTKLSPADYQAMVERQQRDYVRQYAAASQWPPETLRQFARNAVAVQLERELNLPTLEDFIATQSKAS